MSNLPSIAKIRKDDQIIAIAVVTEFINDFVEFLNVGKIMNASQIDQTSKFILQYFPHLNLADLKVFFDKMKLGHYGKFYDSVDGQLILSKLEEYNQERMNEFERAKSLEHNRFKQEEQTNQSFHPSVIEALKKAIGEKKAFKPDIKEPRTPTEAELFHKRILKQFDNLYIKFGVNIGVRALKIGNTVFTLDVFISRKVNNVIGKK